MSAVLHAPPPAAVTLADVIAEFERSPRHAAALAVARHSLAGARDERARDRAWRGLVLALDGRSPAKLARSDAPGDWSRLDFYRELFAALGYAACERDQGELL